MYFRIIWHICIPGRVEVPFEIFVHYVFTPLSGHNLISPPPTKKSNLNQKKMGGVFFFFFFFGGGGGKGRRRVSVHA